jgi:hypothetical protein
MRVIQGSQGSTGLTGPRRQGRAWCANARAGIDLLLAVIRNVVDEAAHCGVCHQSCSGHAFVDDLWLHRFLHQSLAALAGPLAADVAMSKELCRNDVQALAHVFANTHHGLTTATRRVLWLMMVVDPFEVLRQSLTLWLTAGVGVGRVVRFLGCSLQRGKLGLQVCLIGCQRFFKQLALLGIHALGLCIKAPRLQTAQLKHDAVDLGVLELDGLRLRFDLLTLLSNMLLCCPMCEVP